MCEGEYEGLGMKRKKETVDCMSSGAALRTVLLFIYKPAVIILWWEQHIRTTDGQVIAQKKKAKLNQKIPASHCTVLLPYPRRRKELRLRYSRPPGDIFVRFKLFLTCPFSRQLQSVFLGRFLLPEAQTLCKWKRESLFRLHAGSQRT